MNLPAHTWGILLASVVVFVMSFRIRNVKLQYALIFLAGAGIRLAFATTVELLNTWDEQYHAVVAKHMSEHPFHPTLYDQHVLSYDYTDWSSNGVWLHKPPFFLWLMAISIKLFGTSALAVRIPSIVISGIIPVALLSISRRLASPSAGWWAAAIWIFNPMSVLLATGRYPTDHNDLIFTGCITLSFWAWMKYEEVRNVKWAVFIGLLVSTAVLTKWLTGLWVFLPWILRMVRTRDVADLKLLVLSLTIAALPVLAWYSWTFYAFPLEAAYEMAYNSEHFWVAVEGHEGPWWYHFNEIFWHFGVLTGGLCILGLYPLYRKRWELIVSLLFVYVFFAFAATKMSGFTFMMAAPMALSGGYVIAWLQGKWKKWVVFSAALIALLLQLNAPHLSSVLNVDENPYRKGRLEMTQTLLNWTETDRRDDWVIFNVPNDQRALFLFYSDAIPYSEPLTEFKGMKRYNIGTWKDGNIVPLQSAQD
ncbi:ArnT family glycosyltransferase [Phaeocystidibacter marisrubri]|uniref:Glycosyltransferase RgtA/B/C/D-like domain-containing protein n=1 Tax=Phaeocystidibacter marisrubri TaxID=1577780 RepID=A0A6L3ZFI5_9FLAO|nr:glycosyltransferase family 39 protein [Phaeocystidibacter marisrubri]KAB2816406.1 hypothetical protein F8C82_12045 [Phaeocystidibacter marisrubri]